MNIINADKSAAAIRLKEATLCIAISVIFPFAVHIMPWYSDIPLGAYLVPMFYAPVIALIMFNRNTALITSIFSPLINWIITGHPVLENVSVITLQLVMFTFILSFLLNKKIRSWAAPISYLIVVFILAIFFNLPVKSQFFAKAAEFITVKLRVSFTGIVVLSLLNGYLSKLRGKF
ncbi:MAG: hypothetical protein ABH872_02005 [Candidatus Omnitrophota bacterium]